MFGKPILIIGNKRYNIHSSNGPKATWRCDKWRRGKCRTTITTLANSVIKMNKNHNHD